MSFKSVLKFLGVRQNSRTEQVFLTVDESAISSGNAGLLEGANYATIVKNGTGDYTITMNRVGRRDCHLSGIVSLTDRVNAFVESYDESIFNVICKNDAGSAANADFMLTVTQFFSSLQR